MASLTRPAPEKSSRATMVTNAMALPMPMVLHAGPTIELSDTGGPERPNWQAVWPAGIRSSDLGWIVPRGSSGS
jgi:hypothetical protein